MNSKPLIQPVAQQHSADIIFTPEENDCEPDAPECQLADKFVEALMFGNGSAAAAALLGLKELDGVPLEYLASLFQDNQAVDYLFPYRLEFRNRRRGKPKHQPSSDDLSTPEKKLIDALMRGDRIAAGAALRNKKRLSGAALELMAQLLEDSPSFPTRLLFRYRGRGRPYHPLRAKSFGRYLAVEHAKSGFVKADVLEGKKLPRMKSAVGKAGDQTNCSRPTLYRAVKRHRPKSVNL